MYENKMQRNKALNSR